MVTLRTKVRLRGEGMTTCGEFTVRKADGELYVDQFLRRWIRLRGSFRLEKALARTQRFWKRWSRQNKY